MAMASTPRPLMPATTTEKMTASRRGVSSKAPLEASFINKREGGDHNEVSRWNVVNVFLYGGKPKNACEACTC